VINQSIIKRILKPTPSRVINYKASQSIKKELNESGKYRLDGRTVDARASCAGGREFEFQRPAKSYNGSPQCCKRFATASTSFSLVAVLPWRYDAEMGIANSLHASV